MSGVCLSVWRLSVAHIWPKSRTERPRKTKIGTEATRDSDTTFKVKRSRSLSRSVWNFGTAACHLTNTSTGNSDCTHFYLYSLGGSNLRKLSLQYYNAIQIADNNNRIFVSSTAPGPNWNGTAQRHLTLPRPSACPSTKVHISVSRSRIALCLPESRL